MRAVPAPAPVQAAPVFPALSVVVPCFNEERGLGVFLAALSAALRAAGVAHELVVVDDGSTDGTAAAAELAGARVLRHGGNQGYGASLVSGIKASSHDWVATIDGDGQFAPAELLKLLAHAADADMVIGRRSGRSLWGGPGWTLLRCCQLLLASFVAGRAVPDPNSGLRLVRRRALAESLRVVCLGFSFSTTLTLSFLADARRVAFVPVECSAGGPSKVRLWRDTLLSLRMMLLVLWHFKPWKLALLAGAAAFLAALLGGTDVRHLRALLG